MPAMRERTIHHRGFRLNLATSKADRPPLLFLHGVVRQWRSFEALMPSFAEDFQINALDFRGHGGSDRVPDSYFVKDFVEDADAILKTEIFDKAVVYGHSLGAMVAMASAANQPHKVRALILEDPPFSSMGQKIHGGGIHSYLSGLRPFAGSKLGVDEVFSQIAEIQIPGSDGKPAMRLGDIRTPDSLRFTARSVLMLDPAVLGPILDGRWMEGYCGDEIFRRIECPTLILQADPFAGGMLTDEDLRVLRARIPNCTSARLAGVGHLMHWSEPEGVTRVVREFLKCGVSPSADPKNLHQENHENG